VQLYDGRVMLNIRHEGKPHFRAVSFSRDGATKWTKPKLDESLPEPVCMASMTQIPMTSTSDVKRLLFANPNNPTGRERKNLSVRLSYDDGGAWKYTKTLELGPSGYSDLAVARDGTILCFYERGAAEKDMYRTRWLTVARCNLEWLTYGEDTHQRVKK
jgi:sialidase-1